MHDRKNIKSRGNPRKEKMKIFRQGDVLLRELSKLPTGFKKSGSKVIAYGESTGHSHQFLGQVSVLERPAKSDRYLPLTDGMVRIVTVPQTEKITHEEHPAVTLPPGRYIATGKRQYDPFLEEIRTVQD